MMKEYSAPGEILSWISSENVTALSDFSLWRTVSLQFNRCDYFVIDSIEGMRLCRS
jgi:hypothetical protein